MGEARRREEAEKPQIPVPVAIAVSVMEVAIHALQGGALACRRAEYPQAADMLDSTAQQLAERGIEMVRAVTPRIVAPEAGQA